MSEQLTLTAETRERAGKGASRAHRRSGRVPAVIYGAGQAPARQAAVGAGLPVEVPADTINKVCASSIRAIQIADQIIRSGDSSVVVAGGTALTDGMKVKDAGR